MMEILKANPSLKMSVPLTDFIDKLKRLEDGATWYELKPEGAEIITWYSLYAAYIKDEEEANAARSAEIERGYAGERISDSVGRFN